MRTHPLGSTNLQVTRLGFGTGDFRGEGAYSGPPFHPDDAGRLLNAVLDAGVNFLDTSPCYGQCEDVIGKYASHRRRDFILATKFACIHDFAPRHPENHEFTPQNYRRNLERSLQRLRTDCIDIWQLHTPVSVDDVRLDDVRAVAEEARAQGKIRFWGVSADSRTSEGMAAWEGPETFQTSWSLLERRDEERLQQLKARGVGTIVRGSIAQGDPDQGGRGSRQKWQRWHDARLDELLADGDTRTTFLLRYALACPFIDTLNIGMSTPEELAANLATLERGPLPQDICNEARRRIEVVNLAEQTSQR